MPGPRIFAYPLGQCITVHAGKCDVGQHQRDVFGDQDFQRLFTAVCMLRLRAQAVQERQQARRRIGLGADQ